MLLGGSKEIARWQWLWRLVRSRGAPEPFGRLKLEMHSKIRDFPLKTQRLPSGDRQLIAGLIVDVTTTLPIAVNVTDGHVGATGAVTSIIIFPGFETNFSSIPTPLHWVVGWSRVDIAGVVHDFLYGKTDCPRATADAVWWELVVCH